MTTRPGQLRTVRELPPGYAEARFFHLTTLRNLLLLNVAALPLLVGSGLGFFALLSLVYGVGGPWVLVPGLPENLHPLAGIGFLLLTIPLHELAHGLAIQFYGHPVRYGVKLRKGVFFTTADGALFWRDQYLVVVLAPLVLLSVVFFVVSLIVPSGIAFWLMVGAAINAAGAVGDVWMSWITWRQPAAVLIRDEEDGMRLFLPEDQPGGVR
ncbi:MAG: DUF3267 domain-containing protein [Anaerolineae bacterium]|nr:DUF3267 domain-containing protein [Anaerolineae bacterium]